MQKQQLLKRPLTQLKFLMENTPITQRRDAMTPTNGNGRSSTSARVVITSNKSVTAINSPTTPLRRIRIIPLTPKAKPIIEPKRQKFERLDVTPPGRIFKMTQSKESSLMDIETPKSVASKSGSEYGLETPRFSMSRVLPSSSDLSKKNMNLNTHSNTSILSKSNLETSQDQSYSRIQNLLQKSQANSPSSGAKHLQTEDSFLKSLITEEDETRDTINETRRRGIKQVKLPAIREWDHNYAPIYQRLELELNQRSPTSPKSEKFDVARKDSQSELSRISIRSEKSKFTTSRSFRANNLRLVRTPEHKATDMAFDFTTEKAFKADISVFEKNLQTSPYPVTYGNSDYKVYRKL